MTATHAKGRPRMRFPGLFTAMLLAGLPHAQAEIVDIRWAADGAFAHEAKIAPGKFVELCGKLPAGAKVRWHFEAGAPMDFNVHYHLGEKVVYPFKMNAVAAAQDVLETKLAQDYCWMWTYKGSSAATLSVRLSRQ
jgi:hypothetical protein